MGKQGDKKNQNFGTTDYRSAPGRYHGQRHQSISIATGAKSTYLTKYVN